MINGNYKRQKQAQWQQGKLEAAPESTGVT